MRVLWPVTPVPAPRMNRSDRWKKRPGVMRYRAFRDRLRELGVKLPEPCKVVFWLPMPPSWPESKRQRMLTQPHRQKPDLDNLVKALWDATSKRDERLWQLQAEKRWGGFGAIEVVALAEESEAKEAA